MLSYKKRTRTPDGRRQATILCWAGTASLPRTLDPSYSTWSSSTLCSCAVRSSIKLHLDRSLSLHIFPIHCVSYVSNYTRTTNLSSWLVWWFPCFYWLFYIFIIRYIWKAALVLLLLLDWIFNCSFIHHQSTGLIKSFIISIIYLHKISNQHRAELEL
jgi:hypothetical protein